MKTIVAILFLILPLSKICVAQSTKVIRIDPSNAKGGVISDVFQQIKYIPLETTNQSLFGKVDQLIAYDKYFFILDLQTNSILIFENNGKFHAKIQGGRSNTIISFTVDKVKKVISFIIFGRPNTYLLNYNFNGKLVEKLKQKTYHAYRLFRLPNGQTLYYNYYTGNKLKDSSVHELTIYDSSDRFKKGFFPYNQKTAKLQSNDILTSTSIPWYKNSVNDSSLLYVRPYDYNIYVFSATRIDTAFHFIFPLEYSLPRDFRFNSIYDGKRLKYFTDYKNMIFNISSTYQTGSNLLFSLHTWGGLTNSDYYLYNIKSGSLICINKLSSDSLNFYLPVASTTFDIGPKFSYSDGTYLYSSVSSLKMFASLEIFKQKNVVAPLVLRKYFSTQNRKSNPVIVQLKLKESL